jgi:phosphate transport system substrate-binding protein
LTVATEDYPLSRRLYLYVAKPEDPRARAFVEFSLSKAGQEVVAESGFIALTPESTTPTTQTNLPPNYQKLTEGASRLSTNFRFQTGSSELDNRALRDLDRVAELMIVLDHGGDKLLLLGFSDSTGSANANQQLSQTRAEHVAAAFRQRGLSPSQVRGFGAALPVGDNSTPEGRDKNRRVEVWIQKKH